MAIYRFLGVTLATPPNYTHIAYVASDSSNLILLRTGEARSRVQSEYLLIDSHGIAGTLHGYREKDRYHIQGVQRKPDRENIWNISLLYKAAESHLRQQGVAVVTTSALGHLAPILVQRFGFEVHPSVTANQFSEISNKRRKYLCVPLEKLL